MRRAFSFSLYPVARRLSDLRIPGRPLPPSCATATAAPSGESVAPPPTPPPLHRCPRTRIRPRMARCAPHAAPVQLTHVASPDTRPAFPRSGRCAAVGPYLLRLTIHPVSPAGLCRGSKKIMPPMAILDQPPTDPSGPIPRRPLPSAPPSPPPSESSRCPAPPPTPPPPTAAPRYRLCGTGPPPRRRTAVPSGGGGPL